MLAPAPIARTKEGATMNTPRLLRGGATTVGRLVPAMRVYLCHNFCQTRTKFRVRANALVEIVNLNGFRTVEIYDFDRQFSFHSYLLNFSSNFTKTVAFKS